jgi:hypothetical protein
MLAEYQHAAHLIEEGNEQEAYQDTRDWPTRVTALQVQIQKRSHDRAGSQRSQHQAAQSVEIPAVKAQNRQALLPEDYEYD